MDVQIPWLEQLITSPLLQGRVDWLAADEREEEAEAFLDDLGPYGPLFLTDDELNEIAATIQSHVLVGYGPARIDAVGNEHAMCLWVSKQSPTELLLAVDRGVPPWLWIPVDQAPQALNTVMERYERTASPAEGQGRSCRLMLGFRGAGLPSLAEIENAFVMSEVCDAGLLRPGTVPGGDGVTILPTMWSRARLTIEDVDDAAVVQIDYEPCQEEAVVEAFNARFGTGFPLDVPVDVPAALFGHACISYEQFESRGNLQSDDDSTVIATLCVCTWLDHPSLAEHLEWARGHRSDAVRETAQAIAASLGTR